MRITCPLLLGPFYYVFSYVTPNISTVSIWSMMIVALTKQPINEFSKADNSISAKNVLSQLICCNSRTRANHFLPFAVASIVTQYATNVSNTCLVAFAYFQGEFFQHKNIGCVIKSICLCGFTINQISQLLGLYFTHMTLNVIWSFDVKKKIQSPNLFLDFYGPNNIECHV